MTHPDFSSLDVERLLRCLRAASLSPEDEAWLAQQISAPTLSAGLWALAEAVFPEHLYRRLQTLALSAYADDAPAPTPAAFPAFDLSFLPQTPEPAAPPQTGLWEAMEVAGQTVQHLFTDIRIRVAEEWASFAMLPASLVPVPAVVPVMRDAQTPGRHGQALPLTIQEDNFSIGLLIGPVTHQQAVVGVQVVELASQQPLERVRITLRDAERRLLTSELTPADGRVTFAHVRSGHYLIEVKHRGKRWELPVTLTWEA